jgi:N-acetylglucosamine-6-phosphate deacetylase
MLGGGHDQLSELTVLTNGTIITPMREIPNGAVKFAGGLIQDVGPADQVVTGISGRIIDIGGAYISPGFIDLHMHGAWGGDVMAATMHDLEVMSNGLVKGGVTSFMPTTLSGPLPEIDKAVRCIEAGIAKGTSGAKILGAHLEGPYFNPEQSGAQNPRYIIQPNPTDYLPLLDRYPCIKRFSAAPEMPGGDRLGQELQKRGIVAAIAHSNATYQEVLQAIEHGYTHATHVYSGMSGLQRVDAYRVAGVIEAVLLLDELTTEMIADGHHLPPSLMKLVLKTKGTDHVCLVTDSMAAAGLGPGNYRLGGLEVVVEDDIPDAFEIPTRAGNYVAKLPDRSAFASSVATMDQLVRNMVKLVGLSIPEAVKLATVNPARFQGVNETIGTIAKGKQADLVVFGKELDILMTVVGGKIVYQKSCDASQSDFHSFCAVCATSM